MLHIVQGGPDNGDLEEIASAIARRRRVNSWIVPKGVRPGDEVVIYVARFGFYATATVAGKPAPRADWVRRYGAALSDFALIRPAISLGVIQRRIPALAWARYPRSVTTLSGKIARQVQGLIKDRRISRGLDMPEDLLPSANIGELRALALGASRQRLAARRGSAVYRTRAEAIRRYVLLRARGRCEGCREEAPFLSAVGQRPYLEPHHTTRVSDDGPDHPAHVIALCPNCHRRAHLSHDAKPFNSGLKRRLKRIEPSGRARDRLRT